jgi:hypothetical protein
MPRSSTLPAACTIAPPARALRLVRCGPAPLLALALFISACSQAAPTAPKASTAPAAASAVLPGADRDAHGCIGSAGYIWCARTQRCERPWELAAAQKFANTSQAFDKFCAATPDAAKTVAKPAPKP